MTQNIHMPGNSDLFIFCDQPYSPADLSVTYSHVRQTAFLLDTNNYCFLLLNRGSSLAKYIRW